MAGMQESDGDRRAPLPTGDESMRRRPTPVRASTRVVGFEQLVAAFAAGQSSANTRSAYTTDLERFAQWCARSGTAPLTVESDQLDEYRDSCAVSGVSPATVSRRLATLSSFFAYAVAQGGLDVSPMEGVERPVAGDGGGGATETLDAEQAAAFVSAGGRLSPKTALLINLLLLDGLKLGEAIAADASELNDGCTTIEVTRRRRAAEVVLQPATTAAAQAYLQGRQHGPLLCSDSPTTPLRRLSRFGADYLLKQAALEASLPVGVSANTLRRSYVALAHEAGNSLEEIRDRLGHEDIRTTRRHLRPT